jgi:hypothetical protein
MVVDNSIEIPGIHFQDQNTKKYPTIIGQYYCRNQKLVETKHFNG